MIFAEVLTFSPKSPCLLKQKYWIKGEEVLGNRGRGTGKQEESTGKQGERYWVARYGRPPPHIRASARISVGGRAYIFERALNSDFYSVGALGFDGEPLSVAGFLGK